MLKVAGISLPAEAERADRLQKLVLARIAGVRPGVDKGVDKGVIAADLAAFAGPQMPATRWRAAVEAAIEALAAAKLIAGAPAGFTVTKAGATAVAKFLGAPVSSGVTWDQACNLWLVAKALNVRKGPAKRMAALAAAEGLRAAIVMHAYGLSLKGKATPARLRQALAATALKRAFSGQGASGLADKLGLSARASRLLAAQLLDKPRDPGTDRRLIAALAAQACGSSSAELPALRSAVLRRFLSVDKQAPEPAPVARMKREPKPQPALPPSLSASAQHGTRSSLSPPVDAARVIPAVPASPPAAP
ncbi:MAG TPA: hypothetical protein VFY92_07370, partial [Hyphomicrobiaceae bacterium]|nr:hypothetical protein [Hyphomicrobiaceae bacterium]